VRAPLAAAAARPRQAGRAAAMPRRARARAPLLPLLLAASLPPRAARALDNGLGATPAMGWSSWNTFRCDISAALILQVADAVVSSGLADAGYRYINVDDCWMRHGRDAEGHLVVDAEKFPDGMKALGDALHARGLLFGIYSAVRARRGARRGACCDGEGFCVRALRVQRARVCVCAGGQQDVRGVRGVVGARRRRRGGLRGVGRGPRACTHTHTHTRTHARKTRETRETRAAPRPRLTPAAPSLPRPHAQCHVTPCHVTS
jgi:hypothetical protein